MCNKTQLNNILLEFAKDSKEIFGEKLKDVILFGSYARGDYDSESDVDIAILADIPKEKEVLYHKELTKIMGDIYEKYDYSVVLAPIVISFSFFEEWKNDLPFYRNVNLEGVKIVA